MILNVIRHNNDPKKKLRKDNIDVIRNEHSKKLVSDMLETIKNRSFKYLTAPQVGKNLNLFIISVLGVTEVFINPKVEGFGGMNTTTEECLSIPSFSFAIRRNDKVKIEYRDKDWRYQYKEFDGEIARLILHSYDHLLGKLTIDY